VDGLVFSAIVVSTTWNLPVVISETNLPPWLTIDQACKAFNIPRSTMYARYLDTGIIKRHRPHGRRVMLATADLRALIDRLMTVN
jgi:excisionase family DNA binding protein